MTTRSLLAMLSSLILAAVACDSNGASSPTVRLALEHASFDTCNDTFLGFGADVFVTNEGTRPVHVASIRFESEAVTGTLEGGTPAIQPGQRSRVSFGFVECDRPGVTINTGSGFDQTQPLRLVLRIVEANTGEEIEAELTDELFMGRAFDCCAAFGEPGSGCGHWGPDPICDDR